jgi:hypothetical protein
MKESILPPAALSENHRRSISTTLQLVDKALCEWERWEKGDVPSAAMYQQQDTLSLAQKRELRGKIAEVRQLIVRLRDDLQLKPSRPATSQLIVGQATVLWEMLADLESRSLQGYGNVPEELARYLDPIGKQLAEEMNEMSQLFSQPVSSTITSR